MDEGIHELMTCRGAMKDEGGFAQSDLRLCSGVCLCPVSVFAERADEASPRNTKSALLCGVLCLRLCAFWLKSMGRLALTHDRRRPKGMISLDKLKVKSLH